MKIKQLMSERVWSISADNTLNEAARLLWEKDCGVLPVISDDKKVVGIITDRDITMASYTRGKTLSELFVKDSMARAVVTCQEEESLVEAQNMMSSHAIRRLPVVNRHQQLVGMLSLNDLALEYKKSKGKTITAAEIADTVADVCAHRKIINEELVAA